MDDPGTARERASTADEVGLGPARLGPQPPGGYARVSRKNRGRRPRRKEWASYSPIVSIVYFC